MLHVLVVILKLIGIIILTILLLALFLLTIVLFVPVRYRAYAIKKDERYAKANVSWLLHLLHFNLYYDENGLQTTLKIAGISSQNWQDLFLKIKRIFVRKNGIKSPSSDKKKRSSQKKKKSQEVIVKEKKEESYEFDSKTITEHPKLSKETKVESQRQNTDEKKIPKNENNKIIDSAPTPKAKQPKKKSIHWLNKIIKKIKNIIARFKNIAKKVILTLRNAKDKIEEIKSFLQDEGNRQAFILGKGQLYRLIRHIKPKKYKINLKFGTGDPASTGQVLGILGMLMPLYKKNATIIPDFENIILEGDIYMKGRITIAKLLLLGFQLYRDKNVKRCYQMIMD